MKILLINDYGFLAGGAEVIVFSLRDALRRRGHTVRVFSSSAGHRQSDLIADHVALGSTGRWRTMLQSANVVAARQLRRVLVEFQPDVAHVSLYLTQLSPLILRELTHVPMMYYVQWHRPICPLGTRLLPNGASCEQRPGIACYKQGCVPLQDIPPLAVQRRLDRIWGSRSIDRVTAISHAVAQCLKTYGAAHLQAPNVLHPGTSFAKPRREFGAEPHVVAAGRLVPEKGMDVLIRAFARLASNYPTAMLTIIGDGPERENLEQLARQQDIGRRVSFAGHQSHQVTLETMRKAWCVCVPSIWQEPFGMVAAEAQMHGVPVVASAVGGLAEIIIEGTTGHYAAAGDVGALAHRLDAVLSDRAKTTSMGMAAHQHACANFNLERFAEKTEKILQNLCTQAA